MRLTFIYESLLSKRMESRVNGYVVLMTWFEALDKMDEGVFDCIMANMASDLDSVGDVSELLGWEVVN